MPVKRWVRAAKIKDIREDCAIVFESEGKTIAIFKAGKEFYAINNSCPHKAGPLAEGSLTQQELTCPWHAWSFDIKTGACLTVPGVKIATYPVRTENNDVFVQI